MHPASFPIIQSDVWALLKPKLPVMSSITETAKTSIGGLVEPIIQVAQKKAAESYQKWCLSWMKGPELDDALSVLEKAIAVAEKSGSTISKSLVSELWTQKAAYHEQKLFRLSTKHDADKSLECYRKAVETNPGNHQAMYGIALVLHRHYNVTGDRQTLERFLDALNELWPIVSQDDPIVVDLLLFTAIALFERAEYDGSIDDIDIAIELVRVRDWNQDHAPERSLIFDLMSLNLLVTRFHISQDVTDLEKAEKIVSELSTKPEVEPTHKPFKQEMLGNFYLAKFEVYKKHEDMMSMCKSYFEMLTSISKNSSCPQVSKITASWQIAKSLRLSYHWGYEPLILNRAHSFAVDSLNMIQARKSEWPVQQVEAAVRFTLGEIQRSRFEKYGAAPLLEDSVSQFRSSVLLTPRGEDTFGRRAAELAGILRKRAGSPFVDQAQISTDLAEAQYWIQQMILGPFPMRYSDRIEMIQQLGHLVWALPTSESESTRIDKVIRHYSCAVDMDCKEFGPHIQALRSTAEAWTGKSKLSKDAEKVKDLETALEFLDRIESLSKERGTRATGHLPPLATALLALFEVTSNVDYGIRCAETNWEIFANSKYELQAKLKAATMFALVAARLFMNKDLKVHLTTGPFAKIQFDEALASALELVDEILSDTLARPQQLSRMREYHLYSYLCVWAAKIAEKKPLDIIRTYERGRSVILTRLLNRRTPTSELKDRLPDLANRYQELREQLSIAGTDDVFKNQPRDKYRIESQLKQVVMDIRKNQGFEHFQQPYITDKEFEELPQGGPIVMLVAGIGSTNGTALVIARGQVYRQELVGYCADTCKAQYAHLTAAIKHWQSFGEDNGGLDNVLSLLWYQVAEPVLNKLGFQGSRGDDGGAELPRVWWILCDWANRLPIHAAGDHRKARDTGEPCTVMDRVISSYSPTLRSLIYSRTRMRELEPGDTAVGGREAIVQQEPTKELPQTVSPAVPSPTDAKTGDSDIQQGNPASERNLTTRSTRRLSVTTPTTPDLRTEDPAIPIQELSISIEYSPKQPRALLAAMPTTPDHRPLPNAVTEIHTAQSLLSPSYTISSFSSPAPTRKDIIKGLQTCTIAHLACHGDADPLDPLKSKLLLSDWGPKPLRVSFLMRMEMRKCQLAYLSACETAVNHDHDLAEEALHICGAFQMAGVPNVIATLWEILDEEACTIAGEFYKRLRGEEGGRKVDVRRSARALHGAARNARKAGMSPFVWAGYAHFGA